MKRNNILNLLFVTCLLCPAGMAFAQDTEGEMEMAEQLVPTVNVNAADAETIADVLLGVGITKASAIVAYREKHGRFYSAEELSAVKGIGQSTIKKNAGRITTQ